MSREWVVTVPVHAYQDFYVDESKASTEEEAIAIVRETWGDTGIPASGVYGYDLDINGEVWAELPEDND